MTNSPDPRIFKARKYRITRVGSTTPNTTPAEHFGEVPPMHWGLGNLPIQEFLSFCPKNAPKSFSRNAVMQKMQISWDKSDRLSGEEQQAVLGYLFELDNIRVEAWIEESWVLCSGRTESTNGTQRSTEADEPDSEETADSNQDTPEPFDLEREAAKMNEVRKDPRLTNSPKHNEAAHHARDHIPAIEGDTETVLKLLVLAGYKGITSELLYEMAREGKRRMAGRPSRNTPAQLCRFCEVER